VVEHSGDQSAVERTGAYRGLICADGQAQSDGRRLLREDIGLKKLLNRPAAGIGRKLILATNFTAEGEATAM